MYVWLMKKHKLQRRIPELPLILRMISGAIGKEFVIKHYCYGAIKTKYPDMTRIAASTEQRRCRNLFKEAVTYAQKIMADPVKKEEWLNKIKRKNRLFNQVIKYYMIKARLIMMNDALQLMDDEQLIGEKGPVWKPGCRYWLKKNEIVILNTIYIETSVSIISKWDDKPAEMNVKRRLVKRKEHYSSAA